MSADSNLTCPSCGFEGLFDGQNIFSKTIAEDVSFGGNLFVNEKIQTFYVHGCTNCGDKFAVIEEEEIDNE
ncbi:hypothetical protein [Halocatena halophila]|uniref:hypothetical protein n=1 Tax=Halocatena halophila TaxID=2814576 RepID=UPI002ED04A50